MLERNSKFLMMVTEYAKRQPENKRRSLMETWKNVLDHHVNHRRILNEEVFLQLYQFTLKLLPQTDKDEIELGVEDRDVSDSNHFLDEIHDINNRYFPRFNHAAKSLSTYLSTMSDEFFEQFICLHTPRLQQKNVFDHLRKLPVSALIIFMTIHEETPVADSEMLLKEMMSTENIYLFYQNSLQDLQVNKLGF